jgi:glycosyltransferase involved in cell wall biosynthesis
MKISIITAVYNRARTIGQAIDSVAAQNCPDIEHLIIDGASRDDTLGVIERHRTPAMRVISEPDGGIYDALNKGIALASGEVIGLMHSDDFYAQPDVLKKVAVAFQNPRFDALYGDLDYVAADDPDRVIRHWHAGSFSRKKLARGWMPPHPTLFVRSSVFARLGTYDTSYKIAADYEAMLRYLSCGSVQPAYIPEVLVKMRVGGASNASLGRIILKSREDYRALRSTGVGGLGALAWKNVNKLPQFILRKDAAS